MLVVFIIIFIIKVKFKYFKFVILIWLIIFQDDILNSNIEVNIDINHIKLLHDYVEEMKLGKIEFNVFKCQSKSKVPAHYANITVILFYCLK